MIEKVLALLFDSPFLPHEPVKAQFVVLPESPVTGRFG
jgi:hypothetical protein